MMSTNTGNSVLSLFLFGAAIGVGVGILFAPDKGSKTREKIKEGFDDAKENLKHTFEEVADELKNKMSESKYDFEETYQDIVSIISHKAEDAISFLENKLAHLKEENAKFQKKTTANHNGNF